MIVQRPNGVGAQHLRALLSQLNKQALQVFHKRGNEKVQSEFLRAGSHEPLGLGSFRHVAGLCFPPISYQHKAVLCGQCELSFPTGMSLPANQLKEPSQESLPANQLKEHSQEESRILGFDPDIVSAPLRSGCSPCPERPTSNPRRTLS